MGQLTSRERMMRTIRREPVDRIPVYESFWGDTRDKWAADGCVKKDENLHRHFNHDITMGGWLNMTGNLDFEEVILEETEETKLVKNGNGASLRYHKQHAATPEHVDFTVKDRATWEEHVRPHLVNEDWYERRIPFEGFRNARKEAEDLDLYMCWGGINVFECMHPVAGHEYMLMGMALDPDWVKDMCNVYADLIIDLLDILFEREGKPDAVWFYEDMGFKGKPFMSPDMYMDIVFPAHKKTFDFAHSLDLPVIIHSCGFVEPLVPGLVEAGMDMLQAMEVKAGMDLVKLKKNFGDRIGFMGGLDVRTLVANDRNAIVEELEKKVPAAMKGGGYCLHSDHSIPDQVEYETYKYFVEKGIEIGTF